MKTILLLGKALEEKIINRLNKEVDLLFIFTDTKTSVPRHLEKVTKRYQNYSDNGKVEYDAQLCANQHSIDAVLGVSESDVVRVESIKDLCKISGIGEEKSFLFRDKIKMKDFAKSIGIPVPDYKGIKLPGQIIKFAHEKNFNFILKPISGAGGTNTYIVKNENELLLLLEENLFDFKTMCEKYIIEEFIDGSMYHVDGIVHKGKVACIYVFEYQTSCLSYKENKGISSCMLSSDSNKSKTLSDYTKKICEYFPFPDTSPFHIEYFITKEGNVLLCEVASRAGGGPIVETIEDKTGLNLIEIALLGQIKSINVIDFLKNEKKDQELRGWLLVPTQNGKLTSFPNEVPFPYVSRYMPNAYKGQLVYKGNKAADNIAQFIIKGASISELKQNLKDIEHWFNHNTTWMETE